MVFWKVTQQSSYVNRSPDLFSVFYVHVSHELLWHRKKRILYSSNFKYFLFLSFPLNPWTFQVLGYIWHFHVFVSQKFIYRIRIVYWWNAETTITHQDLWLGNWSLALNREVNLATQSSASSADAASSADEIRESGRAFQSLIVWGNKLPL